MSATAAFRYEDGSVDTSDEVLLAMNKKLRAISNPIAGKIYCIEGRRCLCIAVNASYGGGMTDCWAVEGHSAQMTIIDGDKQFDGYIKGKCLKIAENPLGIVFQRGKERVAWTSSGIQDFEKTFINIEDIGRYDINWY